MAKYRTTGSIATVSGEREDIKIVDKIKSFTELLAIESNNGNVLMPTEEDRRGIAASRQYDATFIDDDFVDDDDITDEEVAAFLREASEM